MKNFKIILIAFLIIPLFVFPQKKSKDSIIDKPERSAFEAQIVIDNASNVLYNRNTLDVQMSHRFGTINGGNNDLAGIWAPSNIRIGLSYSVLDRVTVGYGTSKFDRLQDFNLKLALLRQTRSGKVPLSITYYGNWVISALPEDHFNLIQDRYSFFNQIIFARRFNSKLSLQIAPSISHYNVVESFMQNDRIAIAFGGRYKVSPNTAILLDYSQPITQFDDDPDRPDVDLNLPGISAGVEFATSGHVFQILISNYNGIVPQKNYMYNQNDFFKGDILIGFNITRRYNF